MRFQRILMAIISGSIAAIAFCLLMVYSSAAKAQTFTLGNTEVYTAPDSGNGNLLIGQHAVLTQPGTIASLSFYVRVIGGQLYLGIYTDVSGRPGNLLATTAAFTPILGWNTAPVLTPVALAPGNYWLAYHPSSSALGFWKNAVGQGNVFLTRPAFGAMPVAFGSPVSTDPFQWSFYATLTLAAAGPVDAAPSAPAINLNKFGLIEFAWDDSNPGATYRLYVGTASTGCPGSTFVATPNKSATVPKLAWDVTHSAQVTAVDPTGVESPCSNLATGIPK